MTRAPGVHRFAAVLLLSACAACGPHEPAGGGAAQQGSPQVSVLPAERPDFGGDFTLTDQDGRPFSLHDETGKVVLLFFGYSSCPDMCPTTMSRIASALAPLGERRKDVVTLFVSVDPRRDSPEVLKRYVGSFSTPLIGLTGAPDAIGRVASEYHATYRIIDTGTPNYVINHTTAIFLIDKKGALRQYFPFDEKVATLTAAIGELL
jgi:protein SCO1/2